WIKISANKSYKLIKTRRTCDPCIFKESDTSIGWMTTQGFQKRSNKRWCTIFSPCLRKNNSPNCKQGVRNGPHTLKETSTPDYLSLCKTSYLAYHFPQLNGGFVLETAKTWITPPTKTTPKIHKMMAEPLWMGSKKEAIHSLNRPIRAFFH